MVWHRVRVNHSSIHNCLWTMAVGMVGLIVMLIVVGISGQIHFHIHPTCTTNTGLQFMEVDGLPFEWRQRGCMVTIWRW